MERYLPCINKREKIVYCLAVALLGWPQLLASAAGGAQAGVPVLPGAVHCRYELPKTRAWEDHEVWAWKERVCLGKIANMSHYGGGDGHSCDLTKADSWPGTRDLSLAFLETILNHKPYRDALTRSGVRIRCARFNEAIDLSDMTLSHPLWLDNSLFRRVVSFHDSHSSSLISFDGSTFNELFFADRLEVEGSLLMGKGARFEGVRLLGARIGRALEANKSSFNGLFNADRLVVGGSLLMRGGKYLKGVDLIGAKIGSNLETDGSTFAGLFNADRLEVGGDLLMRKGASYKDIDLIGAKIGGNLQADGSTFDGLFNANRLELGGGLFMRNDASFKDINLVSGKIGSNLEMDGSRFDGLLKANRLEIRGSLFMRDGASFNDIDLEGAKIGSQLQLRDSDFNGHFDLTEAFIQNEFQLTSPRPVTDQTSADLNFPSPRWGSNSRLTLRNARVGALNDMEDAWNLEPGQLDLTGFIYQRLGGLGATMDSAMPARTNKWLLEWLAKQDGFESSYNPQPFEQLADVLRNSGYPEKADAILFAARDHYRDSPNTSLLTKINLWVQWGLIGYGYYNWLALVWFLGLVGLGTWACGQSAFGRRMRLFQRYWYSFDMALPIINLNRRHEAVKLTGGALVYFYFHKIAGFVLVSFLVAGLSGLTK